MMSNTALAAIENDEIVLGPRAATELFLAWVNDPTDRIFDQLLEAQEERN